MKTYSEKLKDPRWQRKRLEVLERNDFHCEMCGDGEATLHVHHKTYFKGREPWEYDADQLAALCEECHGIRHESQDPYTLVGSYLPIDGPGSRNDAAALAIGFGASLDASNKLFECLGWIDAGWASRLSGIGLLAKTIYLCVYKADDGFYNELAWAVNEDPEAFIDATKRLIEASRARAKKDA